MNGKSLFILLFSLNGVLSGGIEDMKDNSSEVNLKVFSRIQDSLHREVLDNGAVCLFLQDTSAPVVAVEIWVDVGSIHEGKFLGSGLSHAIEHMVFKGTPSIKPGEISVLIANLGGDINAYTSFDRTVFYIDMPKRTWKEGFRLMVDSILHPLFPEEEWIKEKEVILREIAMTKDDPDRVLMDLAFETAYRVHPYRFPVIGLRDIFSERTRQDLVEFYYENYIPDRMIISIVGDIEIDETIKYVREQFSNFKRKVSPVRFIPDEPDQIASRKTRVMGSYDLTRIAMVFHTVPLYHPDAPVLDVLAEIVGSGRSCRLVKNLREEKRIVHNISAWSYTPKHGGLFAIQAECDYDKEDDVISEIHREIDLWCEKGFEQSEIDKAKRILLIKELAPLQTMRGQAESLASGEFYTGDPLFGLTYLQRINKVDLSSLRGIVEKYLRKEKENLIILAPKTSRERIVPSTQLSFDTRRVILPNGVRVILREDKRLPLVYISMVLKGGVIAETARTAGISQFVSELLTRGTSTFTANQIAEMLEQKGCSLKGFSGYNTYGLEGSCLSTDIEFLLKIMVDCLLDSQFRPEEIEKVRQIQLAALRDQMDKPFFQATDQLRKLLFGNHPYSWTPFGKEDTLKNIGVEDLKLYHNSLLSSYNLVISIFGDIDTDIVKYLEKLLVNLKSVDVPILNKPFDVSLPARVVKSMPRQQAIILYGFHGVSLDSPLRDAVAVLENCMNGLSSDLGIEIREKRGLAYYVGAFAQFGVDTGIFAMYAGTKKEAVEEVERIMERELSRIIERGLTEDEFKRSCDQMLTDFDKSLQQPAKLAMNCAVDEIYGLGFEYTFYFPKRIKSLKIEDIKKVANMILNKEKSAISIIVPEEH